MSSSLLEQQSMVEGENVSTMEVVGSLNKTLAEKKNAKYDSNLEKKIKRWLGTFLDVEKNSSIGNEVQQQPFGDIFFTDSPNLINILLLQTYSQHSTKKDFPRMLLCRNY